MSYDMRGLNGGYQMGDLTEEAVDRLYAWDYMNEELKGIEYMEELSKVNFFADYLYEASVRRGYTGEREDYDSLAEFIYNYYRQNYQDKAKDAGEKDLISCSEIKKKLKKAAQYGRPVLYKCCFALGMNVEETADFFLKGGLERPFCYKDIEEAVYFFCLNNGLDYYEAQKMICMIGQDSEKETVKREMSEVIGQQISCYKWNENASAEEREKVKAQFLSYMCSNKSSFAEKNISAKEEIERLLLLCCNMYVDKYGFIHGEKDVRNKDEASIKKIENLSRLFEVINGYPSSTFDRELDNEAIAEQSLEYGKTEERAYQFEPIKKEFKLMKSLDKGSLFPQRVKSAFPTYKTITQIKSDDVKDFTVYRKALILLKFFHFFASLQAKGQTVVSALEEFMEETDEMLNRCGYLSLYPRNPYDWMICFCASSRMPLETYREVIDKYYLGVNGVLEEEDDKETTWEQHRV